MSREDLERAEGEYGGMLEKLACLFFEIAETLDRRITDCLERRQMLRALRFLL